MAVYNTCGIQCDNTEWYIESINSLLKQDIDGFRVVISSCRNSPECIKQLYSTFGNKISYCLKILNKNVWKNQIKYTKNKKVLIHLLVKKIL